MTVGEAMKILLSIEAQREEGVFTGETKIVVFARVGSEDPLIVFEKVSELKNKDFGEPPMVLIVPGLLHFSEIDYLSLIGS